MENDEQLRRYKWIFENIQDVYYETSLDGVILEISPSVNSFTGGLYTREELLGKTLTQFYARPTERQEYFDQILKDGYLKDYELDVRNRDGQILSCSLSSRLVCDGENKPLKICGTIRDISERKNTELQLLRQSAELYALNATKDKFFSIIAHDLRSPFQSILGFTDLLVSEDEDVSPEEQKRFLHLIHGSARQAYALLENLLLWARSQRGTLDYNPEDFNLSLRAEEVTALLSVQASKKNISLVSQIPDSLTVHADPQMIQTVLRNLISNALKFTNPGGKVEVNASLADGMVRVSITDNGVGIPEKLLPGIFKVESKNSTPGTANEKGSGLGLVLCREFVEKNKGKISVESRVGSGSTFTFTIPVNR
jgi:PAS domain S-box-containing protein